MQLFGLLFLTLLFRGRNFMHCLWFWHRLGLNKGRKIFVTVDLSRVECGRQFNIKKLRLLHLLQLLHILLLFLVLNLQPLALPLLPLVLFLLPYIILLQLEVVLPIILLGDEVSEVKENEVDLLVYYYVVELLVLLYHLGVVLDLLPFEDLLLEKLRQLFR